MSDHMENMDQNEEMATPEDIQAEIERSREKIEKLSDEEALALEEQKRLNELGGRQAA